MRKPALWVVALVFLVAVGAAIASRNSSGTYSLPAGNPVVSGSTISSTWANTTLSDLGSSVTDSLDRYGRGAMLAPLRVPDGSASACSLSFSSEQSSGLYRYGSNDVRFAVGGADKFKVTSSGANFTTTATTSAGLTANGTGSTAAVTATGGSSSVAISATGGAGYAGAMVANGTAATSGTRHDALALTNGDLKMDGVANVTSTVAVKNRLTPSNIPKAWGAFECAGAGTNTCSVVDGFNIASITSSATTTSYGITITLAQGFTGQAAILAAANGGQFICGATATSSPTVSFACSSASAPSGTFVPTVVSYPAHPSFILFANQ